ncbi:MAG: NAD(P)/FAD-dependent oxidoreductase [Actinobacteria bacterium]|nr:MAG: NAD(P)/FAD-dependent oxidoreductase [Actinomycetota bacterium]
MTPTVAIVGAGFGGLAVALELKAAGIESFTVLERADEVGGVWQANTYPGAACDVPSVIYQFSRHLKPDWSRRFGSRQEIRDYLREVSIESGVREHVRFGAEVVAATFDEDGARWEVELADGETLAVDVLVCATGQLSRPKLPDVEGRERFAGAQFHSAEWDHSADLAGKRVVVVGGGASAIQVVPAIAGQTAHVTVVQRSPSWIVNKYDWTQGRVERALSHVPALLHAYHKLMWWWFESRYPIVLRRLDPVRRVWQGQRRWTIRRIVKDPAKVTACTPDYALGCNRVLLSSEWYPTIARPDVDVVRAGVQAMTAGGVVTSEGQEIAADVVVWCTGFTATEYLAPIKIKGRDGLEIRDAWADGPEAYLGLATPGFPNLFMSYGPNTGSLTNTIISLLEYQAGYIRRAVEHIARGGHAVDVRRDVHDAFNAELQHRLQRTVFTTGCPGWYTTAAGKVTTVWVGSHVEYRRRTRRFDPSAYHALAPRPRAVGAGA